MQNFKNLFKFLNLLQRKLANNTNFIDKTLNKICYKFTSLTSFDLIQNENFVKTNDFAKIQTKIQIHNFIVLTQDLFKYMYNKKHKLLYIKVNN